VRYCRGRKGERNPYGFDLSAIDGVEPPRVKQLAFMAACAHVAWPPVMDGLGEHESSECALGRIDRSRRAQEEIAGIGHARRQPPESCGTVTVAAHVPVSPAAAMATARWSPRKARRNESKAVNRRADRFPTGLPEKLQDWCGGRMRAAGHVRHVFAIT